MAESRIAIGLSVPAQPPLGSLRQIALASRVLRLDALLVWDHLQHYYPRAIWDRELTWAAALSPTPHEFFDYQTLLGYLAARAGGLRLGVAVTEPIRHHPVLIAQAALTLAHLTKRPPILGIGAGERENTEPYGLDFSRIVGRLDEALQIIRLCFTSQGPIDFHGTHFRLERAVMDLRAPRGRTPRIWVGAHGPRMLRLAGTHGDGWYPAVVLSPDDYAAKLAVVRAAAQEAGRDPDAITPALEPVIVLASTEREARRMLDAKSVRFLALLAPADAWRQAGLAHPFGADFRGFIDFLPERYDRPTLEAALAQVPADALAHYVLWGTPEQVTAKLRAYGEAGLRFAAFRLASALVSRRAALYSLWATGRIARALKGDAR